MGSMYNSDSSTLPIKGLPTKRTSKIMYRNRSCYKCKRYPCMNGIDNLRTDFGLSGCIDYVDKSK